MPKQRPIIFSTPMVQAILEGRKTQTRRLVNPQPPEGARPSMPQVYVPVKIKADGEMVEGAPVYGTSDLHGQNWGVKCPYGQPGDVLWVRETFLKLNFKDKEPRFLYKAEPTHQTMGKWKPSIHMPKTAARIWLEITEVKVEKLQDISEDDAVAEGIELIDQARQLVYKRYDDYYSVTSSAYVAFWSLWAKINGEDSWQQNPYVWVVKFKVLSTTGKPLTLNI